MLGTPLGGLVRELMFAVPGWDRAGNAAVDVGDADPNRVAGDGTTRFGPRRPQRLSARVQLLDANLECTTLT